MLTYNSSLAELWYAKLWYANKNKKSVGYFTALDVKIVALFLQYRRCQLRSNEQYGTNYLQRNIIIALLKICTALCLHHIFYPFYPAHLLSPIGAGRSTKNAQTG